MSGRRRTGRSLRRELVAAGSASMQDPVALHTLDGFDEMAGSDQITHQESDLLQSESLAARA